MATRKRKDLEKALRLKHAREEARELLTLAKERCAIRRKDKQDAVNRASATLKDAKRDLADAKRSCSSEMSAARSEGKAHIKNA